MPLDPFSDRLARDIRNSLSTALVEELTEEKENAVDAVSGQWLQEELYTAEKLEQKVLICCHYPIYPATKFCLWNADTLLQTLKDFKCVKAWFNGHHHDGNYERHYGCHFLSFKGVVETEENAYSLIHLFDDKIEVEGHGRETSRTLKLR